MLKTTKYIIYIISGEKIDNVVSSFEEDGNTTGHWYKSNYLSGNPSKYQVLVMSRAKQEVKKEVHIDGHTIRQAQEIKLLGVILDVNLQFSEHIKQICTKTSRRIGVLSSPCKNLSAIARRSRRDERDRGAMAAIAARLCISRRDLD